MTIQIIQQCYINLEMEVPILSCMIQNDDKN